MLREPGVIACTWSPRTRSLLVRYRGEDTDVATVTGTVGRLTGAQIGEGRPAAGQPVAGESGLTLDVGLRDAARLLDQRIQQVTRGTIGLGGLILVARIAGTSLVAMSRLLRKKSAPFANAERFVSSSSKLVKTKTFVSGHSPLIWRVASSPPTRGIRRSITTRSGWCWRAKTTADPPSSTSPISTRSGSWPRTKLTNARISALSSTTKTRAATIRCRPFVGVQHLPCHDQIPSVAECSMGDEVGSFGRDDPVRNGATTVLATGGEKAAPIVA
jgi:hypothetical protein